jgi:hypothetical protein
MAARQALAAVALFGSGCFGTLPHPVDYTALERRGASDLECARVELVPESDKVILAVGCDRWVRYRGIYAGRSIYRTWLLDSPVHKGAPPAADADARAPRPRMPCAEGRDCQSGFGCRIENGVGTCEPLCHDLQGDPFFCDAREAPR